jgi:hypothetical protein
MSTGENDQAMRKILDMTRLISITVLLLHFYFQFYGFFRQWHWSAVLTDRILTNIAATGLFSTFYKPKLIALVLLIIALIGIKGKKDEKRNYKDALTWVVTGFGLYIGAGLLLLFKLNSSLLPVLYIVITAAGYLLFMSGGTMLSRIITDKLSGDIFNRDQETFPQEERLLENEFSVNLLARYQLKNKVRQSWINFVNPFRGMLVIGSPGAGKSYFVIRHVITQHIQKGFTMFVYDFKFEDLTRIVYNTWLKYRKTAYKVEPQFFIINFDDLSRTHRCNPLDPASMFDITDAAESARTILMGLNREWIKRQGDFFVESPINFLTAIIWYLKKYKGGEFCTLPHVIEFMQLEYDKLFTLLRTEKEIEVLVNPFVSAYLRDAVEQLEGQIASAKISMARLSSPSLYYVLSGNDFSLDINDPDKPKIVCAGNNPQKIQTYGAVLSLYVNRLVKLVNKKGKLKSSLIFDEFPTIYLNNMDSLIATARSNKVSTCLGIQDASQLRKDYGRELADVIMNITGNIISGQVTGDTAKQLSDRIGKIMQERESLSINRNDTSISRSKQLESAVPVSTISSLSSGEFVGMVADNPEERIAMKSFHCEVINDHTALADEEKNYQTVPQIKPVQQAVVQRNYNEIKQDVQRITVLEMERLLNDPGLIHLVIKKG